MIHSKNSAQISIKLIHIDNNCFLIIGGGEEQSEEHCHTAWHCQGWRGGIYWLKAKRTKRGNQKSLDVCNSNWKKGDKCPY